LSGLTVASNVAHYGGGLYLNNVDVVSAALLVSDNEVGSQGGGAFLYASTLDDEGSTWSDNVASIRGGGFYLIGTSTSTTAASLDSSTVEGNTAGEEGGGARLYSYSSLESTSTDWGDDTDDNDPDDVAVSSGDTYSDYGEGETFSCDYTTGTCS